MENDVREIYFLKNVHLLHALTENDPQTVKRLLLDGADINFIGNNGNTPLHYAVKFNNLEIVELLLARGADVSIENGDIDTPLDTAIKLSKSKYIINVLVKNIIYESKQIINKNETSDQVNSSNHKENNGLGDGITTDMTKAVANEIEKKKEKIKKCLVYLKNLSSENEDYTHKHIITFVFFLEALAFQDIEEPGDVKREIRKEIEEKYGKGNDRIEKAIYEELRERKKKIKEEVVTHFKDKYYPSSFDRDQHRIKKARSLLCHSADDKFLLKDFKKTLVCEGISMGTFIQKLIEYVTFICNNINGVRNNGDRPPKELSKLIREFSMTNVLKEEEGILDTNMEKFIYSIYNIEEWNQEEAQGQLFELLVNIFPVYQNEIKDLDNLRNKIIHDFNKYESIEDIINMEFARTIYDLKSRLYKYYYAKKVFKILHHLKTGEELEEVDKKLQMALVDFQNEFEVSREGNLECTLTNTDDIAIPSEFKLYKSAVLPGLQMEEIGDVANDYMNFMSIIDCEKSDDERNITDDSYHLREIDHAKRREIFDKFKKLRQLFTYIPNQYKVAKESFKNFLVSNFGVNESYFDEVCQLYIEDETNNQNITERVKKGIIDTICILRRFQTSYYKYSIDDVITLYSRFVKEKGNFDPEKNSDFQRNCHLPESAKPKFLEEFNGLYKGEFVELALNQKKFYIKTLLVVNNILRIFHSQYNSYHINFNNITDAFSDKMFLENFINLERKFKVLLLTNFQKRTNTVDYSSVYFNTLAVIFRSLVNLPYSYPLIAGVITDDNIMTNDTNRNRARGTILKEELLNVIGKEDLMKVMEVLLDRYDFIDHLNLLMEKIDFEGVDLYEIVVKKLPCKDLGKMASIFENPVHVKRIMNYLLNPTSTDANQVTTKVLKQLNTIISDLYHKGNFESALQILDQYVHDDLVSSNLLEMLEAKRLKARILNRQGEKRKGLYTYKPGLGSIEFERALEHYLEIKTILERKETLTFEENIIYILTLSHIAYTYHLLGNYKQSLTYYEKVNLEVYKYACELPTEASLEEMMKIDITKLKPYVDLIEFSNDTKLYLSVINIRKNMAFELVLLAYNSSDDHEKLISNETALSIYQEMYITQRIKYKEHNLITAYLMYRIAKTHDRLSFVKRRDKEKQVQHDATALNSYNRLYHIYELNRDIPKIANISQRILRTLKYTPNISENQLSWRTF